MKTTAQLIAASHALTAADQKRHMDESLARWWAK